MTVPPFSRRHFCTIVSTGGAGWLITRPSLAGQQTTTEEDRGYIDAHVHVWTPDIAKYPLDKNFSREDMQPPSFTPEQLFEHTTPAGVTRVVLIQMSFYNFDNSYMLDMMAGFPRVFSGIGIVDHESPELVGRMKALAGQGVRGFRIHARGDDAQKWVDSQGMAKLWETAAKEGLAVCPLINPADLPQIDALCRRFPETTVVVDHFARVGITGSIDPGQLAALCRLARFPQVHVKTSAFYALGKKTPPYQDLLPMIRQVRDAFGPERLMWASDCPYQVQGVHTYEASLALIRDAATQDLSPQDKQWLLRGTAEKLFF